MKLIQGSMERPVTVTMVTLAVVLFGLVSLSRLPWNLLPDISYPSLTIRTEYPDAAPAEVENLVTEPVEEAVAVVRGLRNLRSVSRSGSSEITLEFAWDTDMDYAALDVREKIDLVDLPEDSREPVLLRYDPNLDPILRIGLSGDRDPVTLRYLGEHLLKKDLESLDGIASARVRGGLEEEIQVDVDEGKLALLGLPIARVTQVLNSHNVNASGGSLRDREAEFLIRTLNEFEGVEDIGRTVLFEEAGRKVTVADVARVTRGYREREVISRVGGADAVEIAVYKEGDANTVTVARQVKKRLGQLRSSLPEGVRAEVISDQSLFIENAVKEVRSNALIGGVLAIFVLYLFLRDRRSTFIIGLAIPLSIVATFVIMQRLGVTLNIMSLGGLALGVGMLVDNAIVVLESINRHRADGAGLWDATRNGTVEVGRAVTASTLTTIAVFVPIVFVEGIAGQIFRDQALTVTASLLVSLLAALTLIPVMCSAGARRGHGFLDALEAERAAAAIAIGRGPETNAAVPDAGRADGGSDPAGGGSRRHARDSGFARAGRLLARGLLFPLRWLGRLVTVLLPGGLWRLALLAGRGLSLGLSVLFRPLQSLFDRGWIVLARNYPRLLRAALRRPRRVLAGTLGLFALSVALVPGLGIELVPQFSQGEFAFDLEFPPGTPLGTTETRVRELEARLQGDARLRLFHATVGESPEAGSARTDKREDVASLNFVLRDPGDARQEAALIETVRGVLRTSPDIRYTFRRPTFFSFQTPVEVLVFGHDLDELAAYSGRLMDEMKGVRGLRDLRTSLEAGSPEVQISFRRDRMASLDLDLETVARTLRNKIHGEVATKLKERDRQLDILVRTAQAHTMEVGQVANLVVTERDGIPVPLSSVADVALGRGPAQITRQGQQRVAIIRADLSGRDLGGAIREVEGLIRRDPPPPQLLATLGGQNEEIAVSFRSLLLAALLAIFMVYLVMASQFESFLHPLVILLAVPLGMVGVILALAATGTAISVVVLIGVILLAGIVVNNAIVLVDFVNQRRKEGLAKHAAVIEAASVRLRPIFMTTATTVLGLFPMALGLGEGAEIRAPMAIAVIGGLSLATVLTLVVIPVLYVSLDRKA